MPKKSTGLVPGTRTKRQAWQEVKINSPGDSAEFLQLQKQKNKRARKGRREGPYCTGYIGHGRYILLKSFNLTYQTSLLLVSAFSSKMYFYVLIKSALWVGSL